jgi:restriction endonuclease S subunit
MKNGWVIKKLGEVCEEIKERIPSNQVALSAYITTDNMQKNCAGVCEAENLPPKVSSLVCYQDDDILLSNIRPYLKKVWLADRCGGASSDVIVLRPHCEHVLPRYIFQSLARDEFFDFVMLNVTGTKMPRGKREWIKNFPIPIPPLAEQKRIVAKIDAAFEKIDKLKANAEKNLANAKELFQSALDEAMRPKKGWVEKRLGEVGEYRKGPFGSSLTKRIFIPKNSTAIKVYEQKNAIRKTATIGEYYITREYFNSKMSGFEVLPGDIIVSCAGTIGETFIMPEDMERGIINQALMRMRIAPEVDKFYFLYYFDHILKRSANALSNGSAMKNIPPFSVFKQLLIPIPPLSEQREIVKHLDLLAEKIKTLEQNYTQQIADCVEMRQAVLREAFEGRL